VVRGAPMNIRRGICNAAGVLVPAATSFYVALRVNVTIMAFFAGFVPQSVAEDYRVRLVDVVSLIILMVGWLVVTIWLHHRVATAKTCGSGLRRAAQHLGITLLVFGAADALFRVAIPTVPGGLLTILIALVAWLGGFGLLWYGYARRPRQIKRRDR
jgi:hypothetical protein